MTYLQIRRGILLTVALFLLNALNPGPVLAVVGQAEKYDDFEQQKLDEFHYNLTHEEQQKEQAKADDMVETLKQKTKEVKKAKAEEKEILSEEIENLKKQLLQLPKRDRFKMEFDGQQTYDSNINRQVLHEGENNDSIFDASAITLFDLSGKKTDLRFDFSGQKQWNIEYPEKDFWGAQETLRYRRKYFRKVTQAAQSRISRQNSKTVEINSEKVRWSSTQSSISNVAFSRKFSFNSDTSLTHTVFPQEAFDQDSSWESSTAPSFFWQPSSKSRISAGYTVGQNRVRTKVGNSVAHEVHIGYFGQVSRKSSTSIDLSAGYQDPREKSTAAVKTFNTGIGYIWQITPKSQLTVQLLRSIQNSTSNAVGTDTDAAAGNDTQVTKTDAYFTNNSATFALNTRLNSRVKAVLSWNVFVSKSHTEQSGESDADTKQWGFPVSLTLTYFVKRWVTITSGYTYSYRLGNEKTDRNLAHTWKNQVHFSF